MNDPNTKDAKAEDGRIVTRAKTLFDQSVQSLGAETRSRLNRARHEALGQMQAGVRYGVWLRWAPAAGVAAAAVIAIVLWTGRPPVDELSPLAEVNDIDILLAGDSFEMLEELEFYSWIDLEADGDDESDANGNVG